MYGMYGFCVLICFSDLFSPYSYRIFFISILYLSKDKKQPNNNNINKQTKNKNKKQTNQQKQQQNKRTWFIKLSGPISAILRFYLNPNSTITGT